MRFPALAIEGPVAGSNPPRMSWEYGRIRAMATMARDRLGRTLRGEAQTAFSVELTAGTDD